ncbi:MAG: shikimate dehydrogenase [Desulfovibrionaceae bacterium]
MSHETLPRPPQHLYGIIGHPLGHTLSPTIHNWGFARHGLDAVYMAWPLPPGKVADFVQAARTLPIAGASVTIPHKETILGLVDHVTATASAVGAVNTLYWRDGVLHGDNTDLEGFIAPLQRAGMAATPPATAMVLGAGGAARAVIAGLKTLGVGRVIVTNRTPERAQALARAFDVDCVPWEERTHCNAACVVNTTPLGMHGEREAETPWPAAAFAQGMIAYDIVYNPLRTRFLREAAAAGCAVCDGLDMFMAQAAAQFRLWTGLDLDPAAGRAVLLAALGAA